ncbi:MAG TPA: glycosyltransferase family 2 protein [Ramlibacter sp.]|nr:glycosyltransferase family 2 protein [Ramlibacter sp.]
MNEGSPVTRRLVVSIVNYRTPGLVCECVASLKRHFPVGVALEIAVVENGSGDDSLARIRAAHPDIRLVTSGANLGFAGGNNLVLKDCSADYVMLLNSDATVEAGTLEHLIGVLDADHRIGAVGARIVNADDGSDQDYPYRFPSLAAMVARAMIGAQHPAAGRHDPIPLERLHGAGMMLRGSLLRTVGLLDDGFFMYDEDVDWCTRAAASGWLLCLDPQARVLHHGGASTGRRPSGRRPSVEAGSAALRMQVELRKSRYRLYRKHRSVGELCALKLVTDLAVAMQVMRAAALWLLQPEQRPAAAALLGSSLRIMGLNPFAPVAALARSALDN